ncbi:MAG: hypothetical protein R6U61_08400 [Thermoplasmata archaeon]
MEKIELRIKKSCIGQSGRARIAQDSFDKLELQNGDLVIVSYRGNSVLVEGYSDILVEEGYIRLRYNDLQRLDALEEDTVQISSYNPLTKKLKKKMKKII